jgi:hypothetical protein
MGECPAAIAADAWGNMGDQTRFVKSGPVVMHVVLSGGGVKPGSNASRGLSAGTVAPSCSSFVLDRPQLRNIIWGQQMQPRSQTVAIEFQADTCEVWRPTNKVFSIRIRVRQPIGYKPKVGRLEARD